MIGSLIRSRGKNINWEHFHGIELSDIIPGEENSVLKTLRLSYDYLPSHLKPCFAFCSLFPKDHVFEVKTLIMQWIAQGLIKSSGESQSDLEGRGYEYFTDLYSRFFFHDGERDKLKKVKRCKMHDLVHDLAVEIAGEKYKMLSSEVRIFARVHHLSFNFDLDLPKEMPNILAKAKRLRTILFLTEQYTHIYKGEVGRVIFKEIFSNFRLLRMLDMHNLGLETVPNSIGKLKHLRYLDLSENHITGLPASITKLVNLQTLKLNWCRVLRELPRDINKLVNLRHVEFDDSDEITHIPRGLGELTNLQTLSKLRLSEDHPDSGKLGVLKRLNNLRGRLAIEGLRGGMKSADANLQAKEHLRSLHLVWSPERALTDQEWGNTLSDLQPHSNLSKLAIYFYDGTKLPNWLSSLTNLVKLELRYCLKCQELPSLDQLRHLKKMKLHELKALEYIVTNVGLAASSPVVTLPSLQQLTLNGLPEFRGWWSSRVVENQVDQVLLSSYFPCLTELIIKNCPKLTSMPLYPNVEVLTSYNSCLKPFEQTRLLAHASQWQITVAAAATTTTTEEASSSSSGNSLAFPALSKLRFLELDGSRDAHVQNQSDWMKGLSCLESLSIRGFLGQQCLSPGIQHLTSLQKLVIQNCEKIEIFDGDQIRGVTGLRSLVLEELPKLRYLSSGIQCLTSLESLEIRDCRELELISNDTVPIKWENLTSLRTLKFKSLPKLRNLCPGIQCLTSLEHLQICKCKELELLRPDGTDMINWKNLTSLRTLHFEGLPKLRNLCPGIQNLSSLQQLKVADCEELELIPNDGTDPIKWENLTSLRSLEIKGLPKLRYLCLQNLPSLQELRIEDCKELELIPNDGTDPIKWENLTILYFNELPKLVALPEGLQRATTLQFLTFFHCHNLTAIPDWISSLCSLQHLHIFCCPKMESLPGSISQLTSLQSLTILDCPTLSKRCRNLTGEDWIKRIPDLYLGFPEDEPTPGCRPATILNNFRELLPSCSHSTS